MSDSIYKAIRNSYQETGELPYSFQDVSEAGKEDMQASIWEESDLRGDDMIRECLRTIKKIKEHIDNDGSDINLYLYLKEHPFAMYIEMFNDFLRAHIVEGYFEIDTIYNFGVRLATQSGFESLVKLGIIIMGNFENDYTKKVMMTLGYHSEFTMYVLTATERFSSYPEIVKEFLKNTDGYGRFASTVRFKPITEEQKKYYVEEIPYSTLYVKRDLCTYILVDLMVEEYIKNIEVTEENYSKLSYLIAYSLIESDIMNFPVIKILIPKFVEKASKNASNYMDLAALVSIKSGIEIYLEMIYEEDEDDWGKEKYKRIIEKCDKVLKEMDYETLIMDELSDNDDFHIEEAEMMMNVLSYLQDSYDYLPSDDVFIIVFGRVPFYFEMIDFFLIKNAEVYYNMVKDIIDMTIPDEVYTDKRSTKEAYVEYLPDVWLVYLLQAYKTFEEYDEEFFLKCLYARFRDVRIEAAIVLRHFKDQWSEEAKQKILDFVEEEPDKNLRKYVLKTIARYKILPIEEEDLSDNDEFDENMLLDNFIDTEKIIPFDFNRKKR